MISGNMVGSYSQIGKTMIIIDSEGNELTGVVTEKLQVFDATDNDVREGKVYASDSGVSTGTKKIPSYNTTEGIKVIPAGRNIEVVIYDLDLYDYTKFQAIVCAYNTSLSNSVSAEKVAINNKVYVVQSVNELSSITKNSETKAIQFEIVNNADTPVVVRFFTYKEIY